MKRLNKLNKRADINNQKQVAKKELNDGSSMLVGGAALAGGSLGLRPLLRKQGIKSFYAGPRLINGVRGTGVPLFKIDTETFPKWAVPLGAGVGAAGAYSLGKGIAANYRTTDKGHAKAVAKRNAWEKEMNRAFAGTKYGKKKRK